MSMNTQQRQMMKVQEEILDSNCGTSERLAKKYETICLVPTTTSARTFSISGLKSRVLKLLFLRLKMMVKSGLEFILKFTEPLQRYLLRDHFDITYGYFEAFYYHLPYILT